MSEWELEPRRKNNEIQDSRNGITGRQDARRGLGEKKCVSK